MIKELEHTFKNIQSQIRKEFENLETSKNSEISYDSWKREEGGGGKTFIIANGSLFDNCAVNFSSIYGNQLPDSALPSSLKKTIKNGYHAMGISVISHPKNPNIPSSHMNVRLFAILDKKGEIDNWWIGGGYDLTPYIPFEKDIVNWHKEAKASLEPFSGSFYKQFSENCNEYFFIPHRNERRGVGGIFFDNLSDLSLKNSLKMLESVASSYINSYMSILNKRKSIKFTKEEKEFQLVRRGRYAEFNLIYDRGTAFGLKSNGRIESILASLPSHVKWSYKKSPKYKDLEKKLLKVINRDWNV